jgi:hypothetical protein
MFMPRFVAKAAWQKQNGCEVCFFVNDFKESPPTGLAFTKHTAQDPWYVLAFGSLQRDHVRAGNSVAGHICS